jgi:hypothetical protein
MGEIESLCYLHRPIRVKLKRVYWAYVGHEQAFSVVTYQQTFEIIGAPKGTRTPVFAVRGRRPRPLDDGSDRCRSASLYIGAGEVRQELHMAHQFGGRRLAVSRGVKLVARNLPP